MSATNATTNYELPVFIATDKPAWLTDWNGAMNAIDTAIHTAQSTADNAATTAGTATTDIATINNSLTTITGNITSLTTSVNGNTAAINTINSLIGNGEPTTTDKTLIGAINEIYGMITGGSNPVEADHVAYDNTTSGLTATNVQDAIDEIADPAAADVSYSNTSSGLTANTVQAAIDEIAAGGGSDLDLDLSAHSGDFTITAATNVTIASDARNLVKFMANDDYSIGKVYGGLSYTFTPSAYGHDSWIDVCDLTSASYTHKPTTAFNIELGCYSMLATGNDHSIGVVSLRLRFETSGTIKLQAYITSSAASQYLVAVNIQPAILFLKDMGD